MSLPQPAQAHLPADNRDVQDSQPQRQQPMIMAPLSQEEQNKQQRLNMRGGRSEICPGRFCFCVPCPIPCDFCII